MSADVEIKITVRGGEVSAGGGRIGESAEAPAPSAEIGEPGTVSAGVGREAPPPIDALGTAEIGAAPAPSPELEGAMAGAAGAAGGAAPPAPVPLEQIEQLGSSAAAESSEDVAPAPEGGGGTPAPEGDEG